MSETPQRAFGKRVADLRTARGLTQSQLANQIGRTASWLSQVERGVQPVSRLDVLQLLADGLGVSVQALRPDAPSRPAAPPTVDADQEPNDLDGARLLISGHPALDVLLDDSVVPTRGLSDLDAAVVEIWELMHAARFSQLSLRLSELVPELERACRTLPVAEQAEAQVLLARTYQALSAAFVRQNEADAAWVAADRSIRAAEQSGRPLDVLAGSFRLAQAFVRLRRLDQAEHTARTAVNAVRQRAAAATASPEELSVAGSLHLVLGLVYARAGDRAATRNEINSAREIAVRLGEDRNDFNLEFGPTNVEIQAVSAAVDLGDAGEALDIGEAIDASNLSAERQARLLMDLGRAHAQRRHPGEALECLLQAELLAPETVRTHVAARGTIRELVLIAGRTASPELLALAERADATG
ncbi:helix-turn-helix transcriptional regulator [Kitasatospora sp. NPDC002040]|uniref:helix-turn-helix domain-containing protein n=1 Tax=Kitasatospora sp. NPDC002040 TaxID=3154661 RepID=UPI00332EB5F8